MLQERAKPTFAEYLDSSPISRAQWLVILMCGLVAAADGFDIQSIAFAAPAIAGEWGIAPRMMGWVFSSGLAGMMLGAAAQGSIADRIGRRPVILGSVLLFGTMSLITASTWTIEHLMVSRFVAGLGMGAAVPNLVALTGEYSPARSKTRMVVLMNIGLPLGGFLGGMLSAYLLVAFGWRAVFIAGGALPLLLFVVLYGWLPESMEFLSEKAALSQRPDLETRARAVLSRLTPRGGSLSYDQIAWPKARAAKVGLAGVFSEGRTTVTLLLWCAFLASQCLFYSLINWLPTIFTAAGLSAERATTVAAIVNLGSILGGLLLSRLADRIGSTSVLVSTYLAGGLACVGLGLALHSNLAVIASLCALLGFAFGGGQLLLNAFSVNLYPTLVRSSGLGAAGTAGRLGSVLGPAMGGILVGAGVSMPVMLASLLLPSAIASASLGLIGFARPARGYYGEPIYGRGD